MMEPLTMMHWFGFWTILVKPVLWSGLLAVIAWCFRRRSAAWQSVIWTVAVVGVLVLPWLGQILPQWHVSMKTPWSDHWTPSASVVRKVAPNDTRLPVSDLPSAAPVSMKREFDEHPQSTRVTTTLESSALLTPVLNFPNGTSALQSIEPLTLSSISDFWRPIGSNRTQLSIFFGLLWLLGMVALLIRFYFGFRTIRRFICNSTRWVPPPSCRRSENIELRLARGLQIPITWGVWRSVILLPPSAPTWSLERLTAVLEHEEAHIRRNDLSLRRLGLLTCILYWFNPIVWWIYRKLVITQEQACDEAVIQRGMTPSVYAGHILALARESQAMNPAAAVALMGCSGLETRLKSILKYKLNFSEVPMKEKMLVLALVLAGGLGLAALSPWKHVLADEKKQEKKTECVVVQKGDSTETKTTKVYVTTKNSKDHSDGDVVIIKDGQALSDEEKAKIESELREVDERIYITDGDGHSQIGKTNGKKDNPSHVRVKCVRLKHHGADVKKIVETAIANAMKSVDEALARQPEKEALREKINGAVEKAMKEVEASLAASDITVDTDIEAEIQNAMKEANVETEIQNALKEANVTVHGKKHVIVRVTDDDTPTCTGVNASEDKDGNHAPGTHCIIRHNQLDGSDFRIRMINRGDWSKEKQEQIELAMQRLTQKLQNHCEVKTNIEKNRFDIEVKARDKASLTKEQSETIRQAVNQLLDELKELKERNAAQSKR